ncbi:MAG: S8 family serine peptidase, partial [Alphaproteobacteria bacterium]|nr:S8 family serine peptidase [Alphaproteobacteria bacterium]
VSVWASGNNRYWDAKTNAIALQGNNSNDGALQFMRENIVVGAIERPDRVGTLDESDADNLDESNADNNGTTTIDVNEYKYLERDYEKLDYASYSAPGANLLVTAPTYIHTSYIDTQTGNPYFATGTSAAAPVVSGIAGLILDANADLGWRDVHDVIASSARLNAFATQNNTVVDATSEVYDGTKIRDDDWATSGSSENWNGGGHYYNPDYGFGFVDALAAVRLAEHWLDTGRDARTSAKTDSSGRDGEDVVGVVVKGDQLPEQNSTDSSTFDITFDMTNVANVAIDQMELFLKWPISQFAQGKLENSTMVLISPDKYSITLTDEDVTRDGFFGYRFAIQGFRDIDSQGNWILKLSNFDDTDIQNGIEYPATTVTWDDITLARLEFYGDKTGADAYATGEDDVYIITDDYALVSVVTQDGHGKADSGRDTIAETDGGTDTLNVAAYSLGRASITLSTSSVDGSLTLFDDDLGTSSIVTLDGAIEHAVGSDGNDTITGTAEANILIGGRGNDTINGEDGNDTLVGDQGNDKLDGGEGFDTVDYYKEIKTGYHRWGSDAGGASDPLGVTVNLGTEATITINGSTTTFVAKRATIDGYDQAAAKVTWTDTLESIENAWGTDFDDILLGSAETNTFVGFDGADHIDGRTGLDAVDYREEFGDKAITVSLSDSGTVTVKDSYGNNDTLVGIETIFASARGGDLIDISALSSSEYTFASNIFTITYDGSLTVTLEGFEDVTREVDANIVSHDGDLGLDSPTYYKSDTAQGKVIVTGSASADRFGVVEAGSHTLDGEGGKDYLDLSQLSDSVGVTGTLEANADGHTLLTMVDGNVSHMVSVSDFAYYGFGQGNDTITGSSADEHFYGGGGRDTIYGGGGWDTITDVPFVTVTSDDSHSHVEYVYNEISQEYEALYHVDVYFDDPVYLVNEIYTSYTDKGILIAISQIDPQGHTQIVVGNNLRGLNSPETVGDGDVYDPYISSVGSWTGSDFSHVTRGLRLTSDQAISNNLTVTIEGFLAEDTALEADNEDIDVFYGDNALSEDAASGNDRIFLLDGENYADGGGGNDYVYGGLGNDLLAGGAGNDSLRGSPGNDVLIGGTGDDHYFWGWGYGQDEIFENSTNAGDKNKLSLTQTGGMILPEHLGWTTGATLKTELSNYT